MISPTCINPQSNTNQLVPTTKRLPVKPLIKVNIETCCLGPVQVFISPERTARDLINSALEIYAKEKRRPLLKETRPNFFQLHYSPFSFTLESLRFEEKLIHLGSRNFFLCCNAKPVNNNQDPWEEDGVSRPTTCSFLALGSCK